MKNYNNLTKNKKRYFFFLFVILHSLIIMPFIEDSDGFMALIGLVINTLIMYYFLLYFLKNKEKNILEEDITNIEIIETV